MTSTFKRVSAPITMTVHMAMNPDRIYAPKEIAELTGIEPQHVRQVLLPGIERGLFRVARKGAVGRSMPYLYAAGPALIEMLERARR